LNRKKNLHTSQKLFSVITAGQFVKFIDCNPDLVSTQVQLSNEFRQLEYKIRLGQRNLAQT